MDKKVHVLIVDDDYEIRNLLVKLLQDYNYEVSSAKDGVELFEVINSKDKDIQIIILDVMMPGDDGMTLCRKLRNLTKIPIIMLTAAGDETDRIVGLELGADDYMTKPFNPRELVARIKAILRRTSEIDNYLSPSPAIEFSERLEFLGWILDLNTRKLISPDEVEVDLSAGEYVLLSAFINAPQQVLSRDRLLDFTQNRSYGPFDRSIDVQVSRLRQKIETNPKKPQLIKTVRGGGYLFTAKVKKLNV